jgi:putative transposase
MHQSKISTMQRLKAFKYELPPNGEQRRHMGRFAGSRRVGYNKALALQKAHYEAGGTFIGYVAMAKLLTEWRHSAQSRWLKEAPVHPLQHALKDLERAYRNFFAQRGRFPRFKCKGRSESFRYPDAKQFQIDQVNSRIKLPKLGWVRYRNSREVRGVAKNITLSASGGKWYASIQTVREVEQSVPSAAAAVGIDMGIARFATLSDGSFVAPLNSFKQHEAQLRRSQRALPTRGVAAKGNAGRRRLIS